MPNTEELETPVEPGRGTTLDIKAEEIHHFRPGQRRCRHQLHQPQRRGHVRPALREEGPLAGPGGADVRDGAPEGTRDEAHPRRPHGPLGAGAGTVALPDALREVLALPRSACGASPFRGRNRWPGRAGSTGGLGLPPEAPAAPPPQGANSVARQSRLHEFPGKAPQDAINRCGRSARRPRTAGVRRAD